MVITDDQPRGKLALLLQPQLTALGLLFTQPPPLFGSLSLLLASLAFF